MPEGAEDFKPTLEKFRRYLADNGFRPSTIECYVKRVDKYLEFAQTDKPSPDTLEKFRTIHHAKKLTRQIIKNTTQKVGVFVSIRAANEIKMLRATL